MGNPASDLARCGLLSLPPLAFATFMGCMNFDALDRCARERCSPGVSDAGARESGPVADAGDAEIFASGQTNVIGLVRGVSTLYWTSTGPSARVASCPLAACVTPAVILAGGSPSAIAWAGRALWTDDREGSRSLHFTTDASGVGALDMGQPSLWIAADVDAYVVLKNGTLVRLVADPPTDRTTFLGFSTAAERATTRGAAVAWTEGDGSVHACSSGGCATRAASVVAQGEGATAIALDDGFLFWTTADGRIRSAARTGATVGPSVVDVATGLPEPAALAPDANGAMLYFTARGTAAAGYADGVVGKVPKGGGAVTLLARGQARPEGIVVTETHVYWANNGDGSIRRVPK